MILEQGSTCIVNAASDRDMAVFAAGMIKANFLLFLDLIIFYTFLQYILIKLWALLL